MARKKAADSAAADVPADETERPSRKARQEARDVASIEAYAARFRQQVMAAHDNMLEGARILRQCEAGTTIKPSTTNIDRMLKHILMVSTEFVAKAQKARTKQGRDPQQNF